MKEEKTYGKDMNVWERWKLYGEMTDLGEIARRYFVMNFFDGVLTVLGIVIGSFILFLTTENAPNRPAIIIQALATSIAIGISGITGGFLSERAERKRNIIELRRAMALSNEDVTPLTAASVPKYNIDDYYPTKHIKKFEEESKDVDIEKISVDPLPVSSKRTSFKKTEKTIAELAERYASWVASLINGVAPAVGGFAVVIPFLFIQNPAWWIYMLSFILMGFLLFGLGAYLAKISKDSIWNYGIKMTIVGIITAALGFLLSFLS
ncbi:MAG: VIT1/CCC1 transporter family protein [Candidatus Lokiarchaeota archaeon]|nr:VIT1/CCC1 transporter family protein [Candidatus Lokiarchaeota archaeon]